jgi:protein FRG1
MGLHFKGEKTKKKSKSSKSRSHGGGGDSSTTRDDPDAHLEGWIPAPSAALLLGPSYLTLPATEVTPPVCVAINPTTGKVYPFALPSAASSSSTAAPLAASTSKQLAHLDAEELEALVDASDPAVASLQDENPEPSDVHHVWVCARIPDTNDKVTFRSGSGKFLASDELGRVSAEREARGMQEEWTLEPVAGVDPASGRMVIKNAYGKYLSVDVVAGGKVELRADETKEGATERWKIMMQGEFVVKAKKQYNERNGIKTKPAAGYTIVTDLAGAEVDAMCVDARSASL